MWVSKKKWNELVSRVDHLQARLHLATNIKIYSYGLPSHGHDVPLNDYVKNLTNQLNLTVEWSHPTYGHVVFKKKSE